MLRIQRSANGEVIFTLSGQMDEEPMAELERLITSEPNGSRIVFGQVKKEEEVMPLFIASKNLNCGLARSHDCVVLAYSGKS